MCKDVGQTKQIGESVAAYASLGLAVAFLVLLVTLHVLKPELDPSWRMISEYEIGRFGWMMRLAFFCWGGSLLALVVTLWPSLVSLSGAISRWWFFIIAVALFGAGIFKTDPITDLTGSITNRLHAVCGAIVIFTFPIAATIARSSLLHNAVWRTQNVTLSLGTALVWIGLATFFGSIVSARVKDPTAGTPSGPRVMQGWPNRFMVVTYLIWMILLAYLALLSAGNGAV